MNEDKKAVTLDSPVAQKYPSAGIILNVIQNEYGVEKARSESINNRAGILISAILVFLSIILPQFNYRAFKWGNSYTLSNAFPYFLVLFLLLTGLCFLSVSLLFLVQVMATRNYDAVQIDDLVKDFMQKSPNDQVQSSLIDHYHEIVQHNAEANDNKAKKYMKSLKLFSASFALLIISFLLSELAI